MAGAGWRLRRGKSGFERGIGLQVSREFADEGDHAGVPESAEAKSVHFREGLLGGPVLEGDAVRGDEDAGAVFSKFAMDEYFLWRSFADEPKELRQLLGRRIGKTADGDTYKTQAEGFREVALVFASL